jgi:hypothetical protein
MSERPTFDQVDDRPGTDPAKSSVETIIRRAILVVLLVGFVILAIVVSNLNDNINEIQDFQKEGRERSFQQRAVSCIVLGTQIAIEDLPDECGTPEVLKYYDPTAIPRTRAEGVADRNAVITCKLLVSQNVPEGTQEPCKSILLEFGTGGG